MKPSGAVTPSSLASWQTSSSGRLDLATAPTRTSPSSSRRSTSLALSSSSPPQAANTSVSTAPSAMPCVFSAPRTSPVLLPTRHRRHALPRSDAHYSGNAGMSGHLGSRTVVHASRDATPRPPRCARRARGSPGSSDLRWPRRSRRGSRGVTAAPRSPAVDRGRSPRSMAFSAGRSPPAPGSARRGARRVAARARATRAPRRRPRPRSRPDGVAAAHSIGTRTSGTRRYATRARERSRSRGRSSVRARSRNAFAPELTVTTGCAAIAPRSTLTSPVRSTPRCTPPMPPVANTWIPTAAASASDAETVVTPTASRCAIATGAPFGDLAPPFRTRSCSVTSSPTRARPSSTAVTAGNRAIGTGPRRCSGRAPRVGRRGQTERREDRQLERDDGSGSRSQPRPRRHDDGHA